MANNFALSCFSCLCTCFIVLCNIFVIIFGIVFLGVGIVLRFGVQWIISNQQLNSVLEEMQKLLRDGLNVNIDIGSLITNSIIGSMGVALIVTGVCLVVIACLGCCGACCKVKPCLIIYAVLVGLLFVAQLTIVVIWYTDSKILKSAGKQAMDNSVRRYTGLIKNPNVETVLQDLMHISLECCGSTNGTDFQTLNTHWQRRYNVTVNGVKYDFNLTYPLTCCQFDRTRFVPRNQLCPLNNVDSNYRTGCYEKIFYYIDFYFLNYLFYSLIGSLMFQLLLVTGAILIYCAATQNDEKGKPTPSPQHRNRVEPEPTSRSVVPARSRSIAPVPPRYQQPSHRPSVVENNTLIVVVAKD